MRLFLLLALLAFPPAAAHAAPVALPPIAGRTLSGHVTTADGKPLASARVRIADLGRVTETDAEGHYRLTELATGTFTVSFARIGFAPVTRAVNLAAGDVTLDVTLAPSAIELAELQVTATPLAGNALSSPQPVSVLGGDELAQRQSPTLGETLNGVPGVQSFSTGPAIGKPVIRGLTSNRVLVLDDGQRLETQQWGDEHAPQVETATAERIEVVRGPASVLYGSDAIGGVINVIQRPLPDAIGKPAIVRGTVGTSYNSNNRSPDGSFLVEGASGGFGFRADLSGRTAQDIRTPSYTLWNSGYRQVGGSGVVGLKGAWGSIKATYSQRNEKLSLTDEDPLATPTQRISSNRARLELSLPAGAARWEIMAGWERNRRREFEDATSSDVALGLLSRTFTGDVHYHHAPLGKLTGILGASVINTKFDKFGEETLIPNSRATNAGVYAFEQLVHERWDFSFGARYDWRHLDVSQDDDLGVTAQTRTYGSLTGNLGALYRVSEPVALVLNLGRGYRAPSTFDLFSNGVHEGTVAFERGDSTLRNETSFNTDIAVRVQSRVVSLEVGAFANYINNFIYTVPTGTRDPGSGFEIYDVTQGDARLIGFESAVRVHPSPWLHLQATADYVKGQNRTTGNPLPNMPPIRATWSARIEGLGARIVRRPYFQVGGETNGRQTRLDPAEVQFFAQAFDGAGFTPQAYTLINLGAGFTVPTGTTETRVDFQLRNVFDQAYAPQLSRIKTNAPFPGMGRALLVRVSADF